MLVSWNWLKEYVVLDMPVEALTTRLMMAGFNHEGTSDVEGDIAIDLEVTSNRPDALGHLGVAREIAVLYDRPLKMPLARPAEGKTPVEKLTSVAVECPDLCPRYTARVIRGAKIGASPAWLRRRLATLGLKSINNVVDVTNYVMMECGQPLHAFDLNLLREKRIVVREPKRGEKLVAIDHKTYELEPGMCVIADAERAVGLGGVMGGADSEISDKTTDLLIESAQFAPVSIRNTARRLKLHSPSSHRFERGLDPEGIEWASRRCCELILQVAGGELAAGVIDVGQKPKAREGIVFRHAQLKRMLGIDVDPAEVVRILEALGNRVNRLDAGRLEVVPPSWRADLEREIDLVEEVARIHGYEKIPEDVQVPMAASSKSDEERLIGKIRRAMTAAGYNEAMTLSAVTPALSDAFSPWTGRPPLVAQTPVIENADTLRRSLVPSLLAARQTNESLGNGRIELFEMARVYLPQERFASASNGALPGEELMLSLTSGGDFFAVKGAIEALVEALNPAARLEARDVPSELAPACGLLSPRRAALYLEGELLGLVGEVSADGLSRFDLRNATTVAELKVAVLLKFAQVVTKYQKPPEFPAMVYDVNLKVGEPVRWSAIEKIVRQHGGKHLAGVRFQETYRSQKLVEEGKKKILFQISFRSPAGTLTHEQVNQDHARIVEKCGKELGAELG
ncbi:MAG: phenylalanine--tRNA ligase subunit beta [Planctomycetia bacterium]|nr:phenylalanine--tRNA ligase subunit beta [Planctomycetia bacterium]